MSIPKSHLELAALATSALPTLHVVALTPPHYSDENITMTGIEDASGNRWIVALPSEDTSPTALEAESGILSRLGQAYEHDYIPFDVPHLAGKARVSDHQHVFVYRHWEGDFLKEDDLEDHALLPASLGRALAALHNLPETVFSAIGLPVYSAIESRDRLLALLDEAAHHVILPSRLWSRWEGALEDLSLWRFPAAPIHADLHPHTIITQRGSVSTITGWTSAHVGDPAHDIAWIQASASDEFLERFQEAYGHERKAVDLHLFTRAQLLSELAIVRWLVHGVRTQDGATIDEARRMLADLDSDLGGEALVAPAPHSAAPTSPTPTREDAPTADPAPASGGEEHTDEEQITRPTRKKGSALARKLAQGEADPHAPTERLRLGPDGTLLP